ncbi:RUN and FYVE domain-containing protein 2-like isoform X1 [Dreissena polymorpha]|uniref:RUN and FYVE domain-containing protein 2-like isoform X1 n=1 Tax=Dreissena polymorpha TaxID=45954 RepID=UPI0022648295|nr:RUN and FYVE domain-containing protein 2-like isoform X1 [Dreissena polymorpha]
MESATLNKQDDGCEEKPDASETSSINSEASDYFSSPVFSSAKLAIGRFLSRGDSNTKHTANAMDTNSDTASKSKSRRKHRDPRTIERGNLLNVSKMIVKELIDSSMAHGRMLDDDHAPLQQFFIVLEHVLRHGLRPKKSIMRDRRDFWCVLELVEKFVPEAAEITATVRDMPHLKTPLGKARAWLRLSAMQKTLADYFKVLIEKRDMVLTEFYEPGAMLLEDEGTVIAGLLVGLNVIDCNLGIKDEDLDQPIGVIDFSVYLKDTRLNESDPEADNAAMQEKMQTILDQKNYLEELNRHLNTTVANLQQKLEMASTTNALMKEDLAIAKNTILQLEDEKKVLESQRDTILHVHKHTIESYQDHNDDEAIVIELHGENSLKEGPPFNTEDTAENTNMNEASAQETENVTADPVPGIYAKVDGTLPDDESKDGRTDEFQTEDNSSRTPVRKATGPDMQKPRTSSEGNLKTRASLRTFSESESKPIDTLWSKLGFFQKETKKDIDVERQTYQQSRAGLDDMYADIKKRLDDEINLRLEVEKELSLQIGMKQEIEMALELTEKDIHEKQDTIISVRKQLEDVKNINLQVAEKLEQCDTSLKHKTEMVRTLEEKTNSLMAALKDNEKKLKKCESDKAAAEETARKLGQIMADKESKRTSLETDLRIEREWRANLQKNLDKEKERTSALQREQQQLRRLEAEHATLQAQFQLVKTQCEEQERTLTELGSHLSDSKLQMEGMKEMQQMNKEAMWASDKDATNCKLCEKPFSVARRKHHCRNCGDIFCAECSDNKMPHPSSSKPVRVCDSCHEVLLQRYSASGN